MKIYINRTTFHRIVNKIIMARKKNTTKVQTIASEKDKNISDAGRKDPKLALKPPLGDVSSSSSSSSSSDSSSGSGSASDSDSSTVSSSTSGSSSSRKDDTKRTEKSKSILKSNSPTISKSKGKNSKNINRRESRILDDSVEQTSKLGNNIRDEAMSENNKNPNSNRNSVDLTRHLLQTVITNRFNFF